MATIRERMNAGEKVATIRERMNAGEKVAHLAREFGVSRQTVYEHLNHGS